jgi:5-methylcytosine-specific restriction endonuclease McrA
MSRNNPNRNPGWAAIRARVLQEDGYVCWVCGGYADTVDHLLPMAFGGGHNRSNLRACCRACNGRRGGQIQARFRTKRPALPRARPSRWS